MSRNRVSNYGQTNYIIFTEQRNILPNVLHKNTAFAIYHQLVFYPPPPDAAVSWCLQSSHVLTLIRYVFMLLCACRHSVSWSHRIYYVKSCWKQCHWWTLMDNSDYSTLGTCHLMCPEKEITEYVILCMKSIVHVMQFLNCLFLFHAYRFLNMNFKSEDCC